jgi:hypothetical protein
MRILGGRVGRIVWVVLAVLVVVSPWGWGQHAQQAGKPAMVVVTKADGSVVRGQFVSADVDEVKVAPLGKKPGETLEPVAVPWKDVARVSNGVTYKKALAQWKVEHREQLCADCHGDRVTPCETCKGLGKDPGGLAKDCATCKGELLIDCKNPKCEAGKMPCPATCLKLTQGKWVKKQDGRLWRDFRTPKGEFSFSEGHVGELIVQRDGNVESKGKCPTCGGTTTVDCNQCEGRGKIVCPTCAANTSAAKCATCDGGKTQPCKTCEGTGLKKAA